jgi:hypothetical protein
MLYGVLFRKLPNGCKPIPSTATSGNHDQYKIHFSCSASPPPTTAAAPAAAPAAAAAAATIPTISTSILSTAQLAVSTSTPIEDAFHQHTSTSCYELDPLKDVFQLGRAAYSSNDFIVPGELHYGADSLPSGPISRRACRIECERLPPFRCFLLAGGFNEHKVRRTIIARCHHIRVPSMYAIAYDYDMLSTVLSSMQVDAHRVSHCILLTVTFTVKRRSR